jgi:hypothetical protein
MIIDTQKPAHTLYTLNIEPLTEETEATPDQTKAASTGKAKTDDIATQAAIWFKLDE